MEQMLINSKVTFLAPSTLLKQSKTSGSINKAGHNHFCQGHNISFCTRSGEPHNIGTGCATGLQPVDTILKYHTLRRIYPI